jgi:hypothetical protein
MVIAARSAALAATARLKALLFPAGPGCHRVTRAVATLAYHPEAVIPDFVGSDRVAVFVGVAHRPCCSICLTLLLAPGPARACPA